MTIDVRTYAQVLVLGEARKNDLRLECAPFVNCSFCSVCTRLPAACKSGPHSITMLRIKSLMEKRWWNKKLLSAYNARQTKRHILYDNDHTPMLRDPKSSKYEWGAIVYIHSVLCPAANLHQRAKKKLELFLGGILRDDLLVYSLISPVITVFGALSAHDPFVVLSIRRTHTLTHTSMRVQPSAQTVFSLAD